MHTYAKYFLYTCVLFNFCVILFAWKLAVAVWSPWPIVATRKFHFPLQFHHLFPPQHFPALIFSPVDIYHTYQYQLVPKFPIHSSSKGCQPVKKRGTFQLNPNLSRTTASIPEGQMFAVQGDLGSKYVLKDIFQKIFHLTLQFSGLVCGLGLIGIRGSRSKVVFQPSSYGFSQTIPRSGAMNEDCLKMQIEERKQNVLGSGWCWDPQEELLDDFYSVKTDLVSFVSSKPSSLKTTENLPPS